jgi:anti-sigma factor RsiW
MSEPAGPYVEVGACVLGELEADEAEAFAAHLPGCADCRRRVEQLRGLPKLLARAAPTTPLPERLRGRTLTAVRQAAARP